jgi:Asp/Glu/hydantoin racemase
MRIHVVNPNATASMTARIAGAAQRAAGPDTEIVAGQPKDGPASRSKIGAWAAPLPKAWSGPHAELGRPAGN